MNKILNHIIKNTDVFGKYENVLAEQSIAGIGNKSLTMVIDISSSEENMFYQVNCNGRVITTTLILDIAIKYYNSIDLTE